MALSIADVRELFLQLWPPGRLYDWRNPASRISRFIDGCAEALKTFGYDLLDRLHREINPSRCVDNIPDWEKALGLMSSYAALNGPVDQRRAGVIAKLREFGGFTLPNARVILAPLLGYADTSKLLILETSRAAMRAAHTYSDGKSYPASNGIVASVYVDDGGTVSRAGAQLDVQFASLPSVPFNITLASPTNRQRTWPWRNLGSPSLTYRLYALDFAGDTCAGSWHLSISSLVAQFDLPALTSWSLFIEGTGSSGLGGDLVDWGVYVDPTLMGSSGVPPDLETARIAMERMEHAHTKGYLILSLSAIPDLPTTLPDRALPA
jgi:hypothetical protein